MLVAVTPNAMDLEMGVPVCQDCGNTYVKRLDPIIGEIVEYLEKAREKKTNIEKEFMDVFRS